MVLSDFAILEISSTSVFEKMVVKAVLADSSKHNSMLDEDCTRLFLTPGGFNEQFFACLFII